jgi:hypothetical protein
MRLKRSDKNRNKEGKIVAAYKLNGLLTVRLGSSLAQVMKKFQDSNQKNMYFITKLLQFIKLSFLKKAAYLFLPKLTEMKLSVLLVAYLWLNQSFAQTNIPKPEFFCSPCGCKNDGKIFDKPGKCSLCRMQLLEVGAFNYEMLSLSTDNKSMAYCTSKPDCIRRIIYKNDKEMRLVGEGAMPEISPDKKRIVFEGDSNKIFIYEISLDTIIDISPALPGLQSPSWDRSGNLLFSAGKFPGLGIYRMNVQTKKLDSLITATGMRYGCKPSPDGKKLAYRLIKRINDTSYQRGIAIFDLASGKEKMITTIGEYCTWSPNGKQLAFHWSGNRNFAVYVVNTDGSGLKKIAEDNNGDSELPVWSADGKKIFFQTNRRRGNWEIWTMNSDGSGKKPFIWE